jgi:FeS assembly SUF system protein
MSDTESPVDRAHSWLSDQPADSETPTVVAALGERIIEALCTVYDPEIPVNIFELGLIYKVDIDDDQKVRIEMTLTTPMCPVAEILPEEVRAKVAAVDGVAEASIDLVWEPPWHPGLMTEEAQLELGILY